MANFVSRVKLNRCSIVKALQMFLSFVPKGMVQLPRYYESPTADLHVLLQSVNECGSYLGHFNLASPITGNVMLSSFHEVIFKSIYVLTLR
jgi:hypothetical protein